MVAFVPNAGLASSRVVLSSGLDNVCGTTIQANPATTRQNATVRMCAPNCTANYSITLQTLIYTPNTVPGQEDVEDKDITCYQVWKQVFGNAYVMESERAEGYIAESMYRAGQITIKEFVRGVALSETYRRRFFDCCTPYRAVELNMKHLLGRGPLSQAEVAEHIQRITNEGFEAEINSYIDSGEYNELFGIDCVPGMRFKGTYRTIEEFNRMCTINSSPGTTDKSLVARAKNIGISNPNTVLSLDGAGYAAVLVSNVAMNGKSSFVPIGKAIPGRPDLDLGQAPSIFAQAAAEPVNPNAAPRSRIEISMGNYMYLTEAEAADLASATLEEKQIASYARMEIAEAQLQISLLEQKVAELSLVQ